MLLVYYRTAHICFGLLNDDDVFRHMISVKKEGGLNFYLSNYLHIRIKRVFIDQYYLYKETFQHLLVYFG